ncbi:hypothetical protein BDQ12DRAFT_690570 [Crucibulum laeve]|uniref:DUF7330 domain-containing protein n=1 Tax=Crucibulum laeve TaxID=68775 RepID=A0A5C3LP59_9AGAR|nr:hypothetical protein BDQ12DRAFT_690570 [Crucibulum laeve]
MDSSTPPQYPVEKHEPLASSSLPVYRQDSEFSSVERFKKKRRCFRFICAGLCFYLMMLGTGHFNFMTSFLRSGFSNSDVSFRSWPIPSDITLDKCSEWSEDSLTDRHRHRDLPPAPYSAISSFDLKVSARTLFFLARGHLSNGEINFVSTTNEGDIARVEVVTSYWEANALDYAKVCRVTRGDDEEGLGLFTPSWAAPHERIRLQFSVTVHLPKGVKDSVLRVNALETDLPLFAHHVDDLANKVEFEGVNLRTANAHIVVESISTGTAKITTANSPIEGTFNTSSSLSLVTANAYIKAKIGLENGNGDDSTNVLMSTSNAPIDAVVSLTTPKSSGGKYRIHARTAIGKIDLTVPVAPIDSNIYIDATTSVSPVLVTLPATYEGGFSLETSLKRANVLFDGKKEDPKDEKRKRIFEIFGDRFGRTEGVVAWSDEGKARGDVKIRSSLADVVLSL